MALMKFELGLRPCRVTTYKADEKRKWMIVGHETVNALFHCWAHKSNVVEPSPMVGGHPGGVVSGLVGIVEFVHGDIHEVNPCDITFLDNKHEEYAFPEEKEKENASS